MEKILAVKDPDSDIFFELNTSRDDDAKILELHNKIFGHAPLDKGWYQWFTYQSPQGACLWFMGKNKNEIISIAGFLPNQIMLCTRVLNSALLTNIGVIHSYWGKGIYQKFCRFFLGSIIDNLKKELMIGVSNNIAYLSHLRSGWMDLGKLIFVNLSKNKILERIDVNKERGVKEIDFDHLPERLNGFIKESALNYELFAVKDINFIKWRYSKPDCTDSYKFGLLQLDGQIQGYVIIKVYEDRRQNKKKIHIMDINYKNKEAFEKLIAFACNFAYKEKAEILNTWVYLGSKLDSDFFKIGFEREAIVRHLMIYTLDAEIKEIAAKVKNIHFALGDNDIF